MASSPRFVLFKGLGAIFETLPEGVDLFLASHLARAAGRMASAHRARLRVNVTHALYETGTTPDDAEVDHFVKRAFASYGAYWAEGAKLPALSTEEMAQRFRICEGLEHLRDGKTRGKGLIMALPHLGSWEWGGSFLNYLDLKMTAVAEVLEPPELFEWFRAKRRAIGIDIEPLDDAAGTVLLSTLRANGVVGLLCDRDMQGNGVEVEFFGERVTMPAGPATLALRTGATLVIAGCFSGPGEGHHAVITPPIETTRSGRLREDVQRCTQLVAYEIEGMIRRAPEQWHMLQQIFTPS